MNSDTDALPIFQTERLVVRQLTAQDTPAYFAIFSWQGETPR
ncbi:MAG TPA: hypothetical protein PL105_07215 [Caldilineaceae bacterium]|nr:hypothetical protein [Caldilineaceae bacterium]